MVEQEEWLFGNTAVVSKKMYIEALDRAHRAEEQLDALKYAWQTFQKYLGAAQPQDAIPSVGSAENPSLDNLRL